MLHSIHILALLLQIVAAVWAFRLIRISRHASAWTLIAIALCLEIVHHLAGYLHFIGLASEQELLISEVARLVVSALLAAAVVLIRGWVTHRNLISDRLAESEQKYRDVVENSLTGVMIVRDLRCLFANQRAADLTGYALGELLALPDVSLLVEVEARVRVRTYLGRIEQRERYHRVSDGRIVRRDGGVRTFLIGLSTIRFDGDPAIQASFIDISQRQELERHLREAHKMEAVATMAGGIAHEFNNLMTGVLGYAQLLQLRHGSNSELAETAGNIERAATRARDLTMRLLAFSRQEVASPEPLDLNHELREFTSTATTLLGEGIQFRTSLDETAPRVRIDRLQFHQVILNLVTNARDALGRRGGTIEVRTRLMDDPLVGNRRLDGRYTLLLVRDTGCGIPTAHHHLVFTPFFSTKREHGSSGLGLAVVYNICQTYGAEIDLVSAEGKGTEFGIFFPALPDEPRAVLEPDTGPVGRRAGGVLVIDDDEMIRSLMVACLEDAGFSVHTAGDGQTGIGLFNEKRESVGLAIVDYVMPGMDGTACVAGLRELAPELPVIIMSGYSDDPKLRRMIETDRVRFVQKPFDMERLLQEVRESIG